MTAAAWRTSVVIGVLSIVGVCGGGDATGSPTGAVALRAAWEPSSHAGRAAARTRFPHTPGAEAPIPPSVSTVEVQVTTLPGQTIRSFADPTETREVVIQNLAIGQAMIQVFGYDLPFADRSLLNDFNLPPSYQSAPISVVIFAGKTTDAGTVTLMAQPFVTDFDPRLGATDVMRSSTVRFILATAVGDIEPSSIDIGIAGVAVVTNGQEGPGAALTACGDAGPVPCGTPDRMLNGFIFQFVAPALYPPDTVIPVVVSAADTNTPQRSFSGFQYQFTTGQAAVAPTVTSTATTTPTATPSVTATPPSPPTATPTATSTTTTTPTHTATRTRTPTPATATVTPTITVTPTPTDTSTPLPQRYVVTNADDVGPGSLRQAILDANFDAEPSLIEFDPTLAGQTINVVSEDLPAIEESETTIDGDIDDDGRPDVQVNGAGADLGLVVFADHVRLEGLALSGFSIAVLLQVEATEAVINRCYIGVALDGFTDARNFEAGVEVHGAGHRITNSVVSANLGFGLDILDDASGTIITGNIMGASADRTFALGNGDDAISIEESPEHVIGGTGPNDGNYIVANTGAGIALLGFEGFARNIMIRGNQIGDPNLRGNIEGIAIIDAPNIIVGGSEPGAANVIQGNDSVGVNIIGELTSGVTLSRNSIAFNGDPGIVRVEGAEVFVSPPVIRFVDGIIVGTGAPNAIIEIFATDEPPDASGAGEGETFLGSVTSNDEGLFSFPLPLARGIPSLPMHITATLTDTMGNTSVFAQNVDTGPTPTPTETPTPGEAPTDTPTDTPTATPTATATDTPTPEDTHTPSPTLTVTATPTDTATPEDTPTATATLTATETLTPSETPTPGNTPTATETPTAGPTATETRTPPTATETASETPTGVETPTPTATETSTGNQTPTATANATATAPATETATLGETATTTPTATETATTTVTATATETPTITPTPSTTGTPTATPTLSGAGLAYVSNAASDNVSIINSDTFAVSSVDVGDYPVGIAVNAARTRVYVSNQMGNSASVIDTSDNHVITTVPVATDPLDASVDAEGTIVYVANLGGKTVSVIDVMGGGVATVDVETSPAALGVSIGPNPGDGV